MHFRQFLSPEPKSVDSSQFLSVPRTFKSTLFSQFVRVAAYLMVLLPSPIAAEYIKKGYIFQDSVGGRPAGPRYMVLCRDRIKIYTFDFQKSHQHKVFNPKPDYEIMFRKCSVWNNDDGPATRIFTHVDVQYNEEDHRIVVSGGLGNVQEAVQFEARPSSEKSYEANRKLTEAENKDWYEKILDAAVSAIEIVETFEINHHGHGTRLRLNQSVLTYDKLVTRKSTYEMKKAWDFEKGTSGTFKIPGQGKMEYQDFTERESVSFNIAEGLIWMEVNGETHRKRINMKRWGAALMTLSKRYPSVKDVSRRRRLTNRLSQAEQPRHDL